MPTLALCGHAVPRHRGRRRLACDDCGGVGAYPCAVCGIYFARTGSQTYCSLSCRWEQLGSDRDCQRDGCVNGLTRGRSKYCSLRCGQIVRGLVRAEPLPEKRCELPECGALFVPLSNAQRCCCQKHGKKLYNAVTRAGTKRPPVPWTDKRRDSYHRRRAAKKNTSSAETPVLLAEIADRDRWICGLCGAVVDASLTYPHPESRSLDHVIPLSRGGEHAPGNVRLAHLICNTRRGHREDDWVPVVAAIGGVSHGTAPDPKGFRIPTTPQPASRP